MSHPWETLRITTPRLILRPAHVDDADAWLAIFSDPRVMRYWSSAPWRSVEQALASIHRDMEAMAAGTWIRLAIALEDSGPPVGMCTLFAFQPQCRRAEIGYALGSAHWGQGYMQEALGALITHGFDALDLHRIEADADPRNAASCRLLERLGFTLEGRLRERWIVEGEISDTNYYGLLAREWRARTAAEGADAG